MKNTRRDSTDCVKVSTKEQIASGAFFRTSVLSIAASLAALLIVGVITSRGGLSILTQPISRYSPSHTLLAKPQLPNFKERCDAIHIPENLNLSDPESCSQFKSLEEAGFTTLRQLGHGITASSWLLEDDKTKRTAVAISSGNLNVVEATILVAKRLCGGPSLMQLLDVVCQNGVVTPVFDHCRPLLEYFYSAQRTEAGCSKLSNQQIRNIIKQLYQAVNHLIKSEVRHADLDLGNVVYDDVSGRLCIIDYGNSQWYQPGYNQPGHEHETEAFIYKYVIAHPWRNDGVDSKRPYLAEEDTIAFAGMTAGLLGVPAPFQPSEHNFRSLGSTLLSILGRRDLESYVERMNFTLPSYITDQIDDIPNERADLHQYQNNACNKGLLTDAAIDLLDGLLRYSVTERMKFFKENLSLDHPFFLG